MTILQDPVCGVCMCCWLQQCHVRRLKEERTHFQHLFLLLFCLWSQLRHKLVPSSWEHTDAAKGLHKRTNATKVKHESNGQKYPPHATARTDDVSNETTAIPKGSEAGLSGTSG